MARSIFDVIRHLEGGCLADEASESLAEVVKAVDSTGKAGSLTIKIDVRRATAGAMAVRGTVTVKKPAEPPIEALMWGTPEGSLLTEDPAQEKLDLKPVLVDSKPELKTVAV
jgi:hypothetical protein